MIQNVEAERSGAAKAESTGEIVVPTDDGSSSCNGAGVNPDYCNEEIDNGEIIATKIVITKTIPARSVWATVCTRTIVAVGCGIFSSL